MSVRAISRCAHAMEGSRPRVLHLPGGCLTRVAVVCEFLRQGSGMDSLTPAARQAGLARVFPELMGTTKEREPAPLDCVLGTGDFLETAPSFSVSGALLTLLPVSHPERAVAQFLTSRVHSARSKPTQSALSAENETPRRPQKHAKFRYQRPQAGSMATHSACQR